MKLLEEREFWTVAVLFEDRVPDWANALINVISDPKVREAAKHPMHWEMETYSTQEMAEAEVNLLREVVTVECTCGTCPIIRDVQLAHNYIARVDVGLKEKPIDAPAWWGEISK